ncbi:polysaccharide biosynthesis protein [Prochlorococcus marinus]|uniref:polysaccharide biosynthesis protein n=1 Tax=Prochlorococcus marinus TaxID=1219 RepID=UPI0002FDF382|nr:polysaccharide biosynthesis protein [Prochlorococcus marinus]
MEKTDFKDKTLLITGGTGSFGKIVLSKFINSEIGEIRVLSRDEKKQSDLRLKYNNEKVKFIIGDVRDLDSVEEAVKDVNYIFHAAALKQVPSCEFYPMEAIKTNIIGTSNILNIANKFNVEKTICLSTDKAVYPINVMGLTKSLMEKLMVSQSRMIENKKGIFCATRYGNIMGSRGSVIPLFFDQALNGKPLTLTDPKMTRFMMSLEDSINLVLHAFKYGKNGDIFVQKSPAATIETIANSVLEILEMPRHPINIIGARHSEKLYEVLIGREEMTKTEDIGDFYRISCDSRDLNYSKFFEKGNIINTQNLHSDDYNSHNTKRLNQKETTELLVKSKFVQEIINRIRN